MPVFVPKVLISESIPIEEDAISVDITVFFTGTLSFDITADADAGTPTWDSVTLVSGVTNTKVFTVVGDSVRYRVIGSAGATILAPGHTPAITLKLNYV